MKKSMSCRRRCERVQNAVWQQKILIVALCLQSKDRRDRPTGTDNGFRNQNRRREEDHRQSPSAPAYKMDAINGEWQSTYSSTDTSPGSGHDAEVSQSFVYFSEPRTAEDRVRPHAKLNVDPPEYEAVGACIRRPEIYMPMRVLKANSLRSRRFGRHGGQEPLPSNDDTAIHVHCGLSLVQASNRSIGTWSMWRRFSELPGSDSKIVLWNRMFNATNLWINLEYEMNKVAIWNRRWGRDGASSKMITRRYLA
ncbi:hypothetical protein C8J57DRAFT_1248384 [Mycena rebaudengoi]|nr:hypothetical protein C8J57DRAFT_1248384 [Mycena rebaudengoi]